VVFIAGPIQTDIWGHAVDNSMSKGDEKSPFHTFVQRALVLAEKETSKPGWFLPAETIGEKIWKVGRESSGICNTFILVLQWNMVAHTRCSGVGEQFYKSSAVHVS